MNMFEKNIATIEKKYFYIGKNIQQKKIESKVGIEQTVDGDIVIYRMVNNRKWYLNSKLEPDKASQLYADRYEVKPYGVYFIFGFSDGKSIRKLLEKCDDTNLLIVCIPDIEVFNVSCCHYDLQDILEDDRISLFFSELESDAGELMQLIVSYTRIKLLEFCILPGYDVLYHEQCEKFMDDVIDQMRNIIVNKSTHLDFNRTIPRRILFNMQRMIQHSNIKQLYDALQEKDLKEIPAIIVSAGPSLDKNVHLLKQVQGKAFIIAVDASVRAVMKAGVRPDLLCSIDPNSPERFFKDLEMNNIYWACNQVSNSKLLEKYGKHIFYYGSYGRIWGDVLHQELKYEIPQIATGGSVSTEAFMLALYLGFRRIILIGQDLAFTGGTSHTKGIGDALGDNDEYIKKRHLVEVEGIDGTILQTDFQMWFYKQWFEKTIRIYGESIQVIDATEGGAKIEGAELMNLKEAIDLYCTRDFNIYDIEENISPMFSRIQQDKLHRQLKDIKSNIIDFEHIINSIIIKQEKILVAVKQSTNSAQITKLLRELAELNQKIDIENTPILDYISMYAADEEYEVGEDIYAAEDLKPEQLVEKSLTLLRGYQKGAKLFLEDFENIIMRDGD